MIRFENVQKKYKTTLGVKPILSGLSLDVPSGRSIGIFGANGAGKSTLLRLIAGSELPDSGHIRRRVRVSWPLGFSGSMVADMSGRDNLIFVSRLYREDFKRTIRFVEEFADLGDYLYMPVKTYSSGMRARLAFAMSMAISFDCYLVDEITAVGDARFQARCREVFAERRAHSDIIMVSHSTSIIKDYCSVGAILAGGTLTVYDSVEEASEIYHANSLAGVEPRKAVVARKGTALV